MKNRILSLMIALTLLLPFLTACESTDTPSTSGGNTSGKTAQSSVQNTEGSEEVNATETEPDYSWFEMPEETDTLTIYGYSFYDNTLREAIDLFETKYPYVKVDYQRLGEEEYTERLRAEIPAGRGPDVFFGEPSVLPDIYKTMSTGIFTDLAPYMECDEECSPSDYFENVLKGGIMFEKQYLLPLTIGLNLYITTENILAENGIEPDSLQTWEGFLNAGTVFHENNPDKPLISWDGKQYYIGMLFKGCGFRLIDYENNAISFDETRFRQIFELSRLYCYPKQPADLTYGDEVNELTRGDCLFINTGKSNVLLLTNKYWSLRNKNKQKPILVCIPNKEDGVSAQILNYAAIPEASQNKMNAWRFIKILLSPELQGDKIQGTFATAYPVGLSVNKESALAMLSAAGLDDIIALMNKITDAVMLPPVISGYISQYMVPYITSNDGSNYDKQFGQLMNALELYKDE